MCIDFDGHHSDGSSFVYINDFCYYINCLYTHRYKLSSEKKKVKSPSIWFRTPKPVRIRQSSRTGNRGVTPDMSGLLVMIAQHLPSLTGNSDPSLARMAAILEPS